MYRIVICDDEDHIRSEIKTYLQDFSKEENLEFDIQEFVSGGSLVENYPENVDLILLDIYMKGMDGMEAAKKIRGFDPSVCIIFITTMFQRAIDGYAVRAFGFIRKPVDYSELSHELRCAFNQIQKTKLQEQFIVIRSSGVSYRIPVSSISYCEVRNHSVYICTDGVRTEYRCSMKDIEKQLAPYGFFKCHASFLVSADHISSIEAVQIILTDGSAIPISQRKKKEFMTELSKYIGAQI